MSRWASDPPRRLFFRLIPAFGGVSGGGENSPTLARRTITVYSPRMGRNRTTLLQMSALARLALALGACAAVWAAVAVALA
jgi:hypothetical protein